MTTPSLVEPAYWSFPIPIKFGPGRIAELGQLCSAAGTAAFPMKRPLIVTDRGSSDLPFISRAIESLAAAGIQGSVFSDVSPNPTDADIAAGRAAFESGGHDGVIAIGGGSGMDAGKAISLLAGNDLDLWSLDYDHGRWPAKPASGFVPLITVPTTAGTGAETESTAMATDTEQGVKRCVWHPDHKPFTTLLDPELTIGLPPHLTAWTGVDALVHAIEAYSVPDWNPMCDGLALEAMRLITRWLPTAVSDGKNIEARSAMLVGSCLAGVAFLKGLGLVHAMSHMVGAVYDTHHGLTNAVLLPPVLRFNRPVIEDRSAQMAAAIGAASEDFDGFYTRVVELLDQLEIPTNLADIGVGTDRISELATKSITDAAAGTNPRVATAAEVAEILQQSLISTR